MKNFLIVSLFLTGCATSSFREVSTSPNVAHPADVAAFERHGYEVAKERLLQMDAMRRAVSGRLAELFGESKLEADRRTHSLGLPRIIPQMESKLKRLHPEVYQLTAAYAAGVNRFISEMVASTAGTPSHALAQAYRHLITKDPNYRPAAWTVADSLASNLTLSFGLTNALEETLSFGAIYQYLYAAPDRREQFADFLDARPIEPFIPLPTLPEPSAATAVPVSLPDFRLPAFICDPATSLFQCRAPVSGSNMWAVSTKKIHPKEKAKAFLASDPHLPLKSPSFYFETAIRSVSDGGTFNAQGVHIPGIPGIAIGRTDRIAWGVTNTMAHVDQVYVEAFNENGSKVRFNDGWVGVEISEYPISVREPEGKMRTEKVRVRTVPHHGAIFSEHWKEVTGLPPGASLSYRWSGFEDGGSMDLAATVLMNRAKNFPEFRSAVRHNATSAGNYLYADVEGNIGYAQHGHHPLRPFASAAAVPYIPLPGTGQFEWAGFRTQFPESYNPSEGYLVVANDDVWGRNLEKRFGNYKNYFTFKSTEGCRAKRIRDGLAAKPTLTIADMQAIQLDHKDLLALRLVNEVLKPMQTAGMLSQSAAGKAMVKWNGEMSRKKTEPLVFAAWLYVMMAKHFEAVIPLGVFPQIGETPAGVQTLYHQLTAKLRENPANARAWVLTTLNETEATLKKSGRWGKTWGSDHRLEMAVLTGGAPLQGEGKNGSWLTVDVGGYLGAAKKDGTLPEKFPNSYGANVRMISSLGGEGIRSWTVLPGGHEGDEKRYSEGLYRTF